MNSTTSSFKQGAVEVFWWDLKPFPLLTFPLQYILIKDQLTETIQTATNEKYVKLYAIPLIKSWLFTQVASFMLRQKSFLMSSRSPAHIQDTHSKSVQR